MMSSAVVISLLKLKESDGSRYLHCILTAKDFLTRFMLSDESSNGAPRRDNNDKDDSVSHGALTTHINLAT